jgi:hypothetical protein
LKIEKKTTRDSEREKEGTKLTLVHGRRKYFCNDNYVDDRWSGIANMCNACTILMTWKLNYLKGFQTRNCVCCLTMHRVRRSIPCHEIALPCAFWWTNWSVLSQTSDQPFGISDKGLAHSFADASILSWPDLSLSAWLIICPCQEIDIFRNHQEHADSSFIAYCGIWFYNHRRGWDHETEEKQNEDIQRSNEWITSHTLIHLLLSSCSEMVSFTQILWKIHPITEPENLYLPYIHLIRWKKTLSHAIRDNSVQDNRRINQI